MRNRAGATLPSASTGSLNAKMSLQFGTLLGSLTFTADLSIVFASEKIV